MRITVSHTKSVEEVRQKVDRGFDQMFQGLPIGAVQLTYQQRAWDGNKLTFSFTAKAGFMNVPVNGWLVVEEKLVTIEVELPSFVSNFIPEAKVQAAVEGQVKGLLT